MLTIGPWSGTGRRSRPSECPCERADRTEEQGGWSRPQTGCCRWCPCREKSRIKKKIKKKKGPGQGGTRAYTKENRSEVIREEIRFLKAISLLCWKWNELADPGITFSLRLPPHCSEFTSTDAFVTFATFTWHRLFKHKIEHIYG